MRFLTFLWNAIMRIIGFVGFAIMEAIIFYIVYLGIYGSGYIEAANFLAVIFVIWLVVELILKLFVGGSINIIKYVFGRFF